MGRMQFRCIIKQFTYLNSFFGIPYSFFSPFFLLQSFPFLSYRLISLTWGSFVDAPKKREKFKKKSKKRYKNSWAFWLNSIKVFFSFFFYFGTSRGFCFSRALKSFSRFSLLFLSNRLHNKLLLRNGNLVFLLINKTVFYLFRLEYSDRLYARIRHGDKEGLEIM
jgi:hypothetical protein